MVYSCPHLQAKGISVIKQHCQGAVLLCSASTLVSTTVLQICGNRDRTLQGVRRNEIGWEGLLEEARGDGEAEFSEGCSISGEISLFPVPKLLHASMDGGKKKICSPHTAALIHPRNFNCKIFKWRSCSSFLLSMRVVARKFRSVK